MDFDRPSRAAVTRSPPSRPRDQQGGGAHPPDHYARSFVGQVAGVRVTRSDRDQDAHASGFALGCSGVKAGGRVAAGVTPVGLRLADTAPSYVGRNVIPGPP
jgi:hypothetical protein